MVRDQTCVEVYKDKSKEWRWRLLAKNGKIIADSAEGYTRRHNCMRGLDLVRDALENPDLRVLEK